MRKEKQGEGLLTLRHKLTPSYLFILTYHSMPPFVYPLHQIFPLFVPFTYHTYIHKWFFSNKMFSILKNKKKSEVLALLGSYFHLLFLTLSYSDFLLYSNNLNFILFDPVVLYSYTISFIRTRPFLIQHRLKILGNYQMNILSGFKK